VEVLVVEVGWAGGVGAGCGEEEEGGVGVSLGYGVVRLKRVEAMEYGRCARIGIRLLLLFLFASSSRYGSTPSPLYGSVSI
jgi:hypothetical protein